MPLLLVKHAMPHIDPDAAPETWLLGDDGRAASLRLATALKPYTPQQIITSESPKAMETGQIAADALGLPCTTAPNLHEHVRTREQFSTKAIFHDNVTRFFAQPDTLIFGEETAKEAETRFINAVKNIANGQDNLVIVAHGTVITLFVTHFNPQVQAFELWQRLGLPSFVVLNGENYQLEAVNDAV